MIQILNLILILQQKYVLFIGFSAFIKTIYVRILNCSFIGPCAKTKMAAIELFYMYAIDTPCECDIFRTILPIDFKFGLWCHTTLRTDAIYFGPCAKTKMADIKLFNMYAIDTPCFEILYHKGYKWY